MRYYGKIPEILRRFRTWSTCRRSRSTAGSSRVRTSPSPSARALGLEAIIREVFPIVSYDKSMVLEYIGYELGRPRYTP